MTVVSLLCLAFAEGALEPPARPSSRLPREAVLGEAAG